MKKKVIDIFDEFFESEQSSGILLVICAVISIAITNSKFGKIYLDFWHSKIGFELGGIALKYSIEHWINDGLMAIFFLLIGLEIERELYIGELSDFKNALLPVVAAIGGMAMPAMIHFLFNAGTETQKGFGIPMATDIAFALGVLAMLGNKVPISLKIFLTAFAIIDDLGVIIIIALFYVSHLSVVYLFLALGIFVGLIILNRLGVNRLSFYIIPGLFMWYFMHQSGVHATIAGVLLAFTIPFRKGDEQSPSYRLQHFLHHPVAFGIMPLFALANTGIYLSGNWLKGLVSSNGLGIFSGLFVGKPVGIFLCSFLSVQFGLCRLPENVNWRHIIGAGFLGGIGFTMSIFITLLAFDQPALIQSSKISILLTSLCSGITGFFILNYSSNRLKSFK